MRSGYNLPLEHGHPARFPLAQRWAQPPLGGTNTLTRRVHDPVSADPIIYCLQQLTDYRQFERLCSDVMAGSGYATIDPLGGSYAIAGQGRGSDTVQLPPFDDLRIHLAELWWPQHSH